MRTTKLQLIRRLAFFGILIVSSAFLNGAPATTLTQARLKAKAKATEDYGRLPLSFEANRGQVDSGVRFLSRGLGYSLFLTDTGAVLALDKAATCEKSSKVPPAEFVACPSGRESASDVVRMTLGHVLDSGRIGSDPRAIRQARGEDLLPGKVNYFIGNDPAKWQTDLPTYAKVRYTGVYPGVDLVYYGNQRQLEYDFVIAPGGDASMIRLNFAGQKSMRITANGDLSLEGAQGATTIRKPVVYQEINGQRAPVLGSFRLAANNSVAFSLGSYDRSKALVIDPVLVYSTYLSGTSGWNQGNGIAVDGEGNAYVTGFTQAPNFPVTGGAFQAAMGVANPSVFVTKFNATGTGLLYSTYLGGNTPSPYGDEAYGIAVDASGDAYVTGYTFDVDFPVTPGALQTHNNTHSDMYPNAFVTKLNPTGTALVYSTYLGGKVQDYANGIAVDSLGNAYVTGQSFSSDFPVTSGAFQIANKGINAFVAKINPTGTALVYSTLIGGSGNDSGQGIAVDSSDNAYVVGSTASADFPVTSGAFQTVNKAAAEKSTTAFVASLNPAGTALRYSTFLGGTAGEYGFAIAVDESGDAYATGLTGSTDFPVTPGAFQAQLKHNGNGNAFISKLNPTGTALMYSTYLGGSGPLDAGRGIAVDSRGNAFISGYTYSPDFPVTANALVGTDSGTNVFVTKMNPTGTALLYSTYLGSGETWCMAGAIDSSGAVYITGYTGSNKFPVTPGAFEAYPKAPNGVVAGFVSKLAFHDVSSPTTLTAISTQAGGSLVYGNPQTQFKLGVHVADQEGDSLTGISVAFTGPSLSFTPSSAITDALGNAYAVATPLAAGSLVATASAGTAQAATFPLTVAPAPLIVSPHAFPTFRYYGGENPAFTATLIGLIGSDTVTVVPSSTAVATSPVGNYPITATVTGGAAQNYTVTIRPGVLEVRPTRLQVVARNVGVVYGHTLPPPTGYSLQGFVNGETASIVSGAPILSTSVVATTPVGAYPIHVQVGTLSAPNYAIVPFAGGEGSVIVSKSPLRVTADNLTMPHGGPLPTLTYQVTGFVNGDSAATSVTGAPVLTTTATAASKPGKYSIVVTRGTLASPNYYFAPAWGLLTVLP